MRIYLVGMMGAGKSYIGKQLSKKLTISFTDLDEEIEKGEKMSIADIFELYGETHFRSLEKKYLHRSSSQNNTIIATGGGTPCFNDNMEWINSNGWSIYLKASPSLLIHRLKAELDKRPILKGLSDIELESKLEEMLGQRECYYQKADVIWNQDRAEKENKNELLTTIHKLIW